jgi:hypothetical protein
MRQDDNRHGQAAPAKHADKGRLPRDGRGIVITGTPGQKTEVEVLIAAAEAYSPLAHAAFTWAAGVGVEIECRVPATGETPGHGVAGFYNENSKRVVFVPEVHVTRDSMLDTLVHEIRHMWQDDKNLLNGPELSAHGYRRDPAVYAAQQAVYEADAHAHGVVAAMEYRRQGPLPDLAVQLGIAFREWFYRPDHVAYYRDKTISLFREKGLPQPQVQNAVARLRRVFGVTVDMPPADGIDMTGDRDILRLGRGFAGGNYLAEMKGWDPDFLPCLLQPSRVLTQLHGPAPLPPDVRDVVKAHKREKLQQAKKRYPLPG